MSTGARALVCALLVAAAPSFAAESRLTIVARDHNERLLPGCRFALQGVESPATNQAGATDLELPPGFAPGRPIKLHLRSGCSKTEEWFLVNEMVNVPEPGTAVELVIMRRSELRQIAAEARDQAPQAAVRGSDPDQARRALLEVASRYGLKEDQLEAAIKAFAASTADPMDRGIAAYLEGRHGTAEELLQHAAEEQEGDFFETLQYLGAAQLELAHYERAAKTFERALAIREQDSDVVNSLALCFFHLARWREAEDFARHALTLAEAAFGPEHPKVAIRLNNLAVVLQATNRRAEAEPLIRRALAIDEASFGRENLAVSLITLGHLLQATNRLAEAEPLMRRALEIDQQVLGNDHPEVAVDLNNLASLLQATGRLAEAEPLMRRALTVDEARFGKEHPKVAKDLRYLATLLLDTGRTAEAESLMRRALGIQEASYGMEHPEVATDLNNLASLLERTRRKAEAEPMMRRALAIAEASFGKDHPSVAIYLSGLARLLYATDRLAEAEPLMRRALAIDETNLGQEHPTTATRLNNLAQLLQSTDRQLEAEPLLRRALAIKEASFGQNDPIVAIALNNLATLLQETNRLAEAEPLLRRSVSILLDFQRSGNQHPSLGLVIANYEHLLRASGRSGEEIRATLAELGWTPP